MKNKVNKIVILGGERQVVTAGYLKYKNPDIDITLIESKDGIIGVVKVLYLNLVTSLKKVDEERDWMSHKFNIQIR